MAWLTFDSMESFSESIKSPAFRAAGAHAADVAPNGADTFLSELLES